MLMKEKLEFFENEEPEEEIVISTKKKKTVSYSQFQIYSQCKRRYKLDYIDKLRIRDGSINSAFGSGMHLTIQLYIKSLYTQNSREADLLDLKSIFKTNFENELKKEKVEYTEIDFNSFVEDGYGILDEFSNLSNRMRHFPSNKYELIGIEDKIVTPIINNVEFICLIDVVLKEKLSNKYKIIDIKTSTNGWNKYQKSNEIKLNQILLYKLFFSQKYNINIDDIDIEFFILKRKLWEKSDFYQSRIQTFVPSHSKKYITQTMNQFIDFVSNCFTKNGEYKDEENLYPKMPGKAYSHCKWCTHKNVNCFPTKKDIYN